MPFDHIDEWDPRYPKLTKEQQEQRDATKRLLNDIHHMQQSYAKITCNCKHVVAQPPVISSTDENERKAVCTICFTTLGRKCYYSIDNTCHYAVDIIDGHPVVTLVDGTVYHLDNRMLEITPIGRCFFCKEPNKQHTI